MKTKKGSALPGKEKMDVPHVGLFPPGHFHSPIPDPADVAEGLKAPLPPPGACADIDYRHEEQAARLRAFARYYSEMVFNMEKTEGRRFYYNNHFFSHSDAFFLFCFLREEKPRRVIEVGSGFSSAMMLDTFERYASAPPEVTFIEPFPARLRELLKPADLEACRLIEKPVQKTDLELFDSLESGDLLFIDSSHVSKYGSDVNHLLFKVLPRLKPGVFVHFHDIFYAFEYPHRWLGEGWYWNECYLVRAFLAYNREWPIYFFNHYAAKAMADEIQSAMPFLHGKPGGSLYLRRALKS